MNDSSTYGGIKMGCFDPHLALVYYLGDSITGHVSICLNCNFLEASFDIPASLQKVEGVETYYVRKGFSAKGLDKLSSLCSDWQFQHCRPQNWLNEEKDEPDK